MADGLCAGFTIVESPVGEESVVRVLPLWAFLLWVMSVGRCFWLLAKSDGVDSC